MRNYFNIVSIRALYLCSTYNYYYINMEYDGWTEPCERTAVALGKQWYNHQDK